MKFQSMTRALDAHDHSKVITIEQAQRGLKCDAVCPDCKARVIARKGEHNAHHFAHEADAHSCSWGVETELHLLAKEAIAQMEYIRIPVGTVETEIMSFPVEDTELELKMENRRPDVVVFSGGDRLLVEVAVTHFFDKAKQTDYKRRNLSAIEIDFSEYKNRKAPITVKEVAGQLASSYTKWIAAAPAGVFGEATHERNRQAILKQRQEYEHTSRQNKVLTTERDDLRHMVKHLQDEVKTARAQLTDLEPQNLQLLELKKRAEEAQADARRERYQIEDDMKKVREFKADKDTLNEKQRRLDWSLAKLSLMQRNVNEGKPELEDIEILHMVDKVGELIRGVTEAKSPTSKKLSS